MLPDIFNHLVVPDSFNTPAQYKERCIDVSSFFLTISSIHSLLDAFTASEITKRQHTNPGHVGLVLVGHPHHFNCENTMAATGVVVQSVKFQYNEQSFILFKIR